MTGLRLRSCLSHRLAIRGRALAVLCALAAVLLSGPVSPVGADEFVAIEIVLQGGRPQGDVSTVQVKVDQEVTLHWSSDLPLELHLHGYDQETRVEPGVVADMSFVATATGRFPIEAHGRDGKERTVIYLEVLPE